MSHAATDMLHRWDEQDFIEEAEKVIHAHYAKCPSAGLCECLEYVHLRQKFREKLARSRVESKTGGME